MDRVHATKNFNLENLIIRPVKKSDLSALEWDGAYQKYRRMYTNLYRNTKSGRTLMWLIEEPSAGIIGQAFVMLISSERNAADGVQRAYVFAFRVKPNWRGRGIGTKLMHFVEDDLRQRGFSIVTLNVAKDNPDALRLYKRLGYKIIGSRSGIWSYKDDQGNLQHVHEPAWRMEKEIGN